MRKVKERTEHCNKLEKAVAIEKATGKAPTITISELALNFMKLIHSREQQEQYEQMEKNGTKVSCGRMRLIARDHFSRLLALYNFYVMETQSKLLRHQKESEPIADEDIEQVRGIVSVHQNKGSILSEFHSSKASVDCQNDDMEHNHTSAPEAVDGAQKALEDVVMIAEKGFDLGKLATSGAVAGLMELKHALEYLTIGHPEYSTTAFVTMTTLESAAVLHQVVLSHENYGMIVTPAPNPFDILWPNVHLSYAQREARHSIADFVIFLGVIFWSVIVVAITGFSNLDGIAEYWSWLSEQKNTRWYPLVNDYLPFLVILLLIALLPFIFDIIARHYEGMKCESEIQRSIMNRFFYFQLANVFSSGVLGSAVIGIDKIISDPYNIINILGGTLPDVSLYFAGVLSVWTFIQIPYELIGWRLFYFSFLELFSDLKKTTRRELRNGVFADFPMPYGWIYPNQIYVMMVMMAYASITPLLMWFCVLFYGFSFIMYRYQLLYIWVNKYQSGGVLWYEVFNKSMISLNGGIIILLFYLALKQTVITGPFYFLLPLPFIVIYFWRRCDQRLIRSIFFVLSATCNYFPTNY